MIRISIRANGKELTVYKETSVALNRSVAPFLKFESSSNIVSFTWDIPYNDQVASFFGFVGDIPFTDPTIGMKLETVIEDDGSTISGLTEIKGYKNRKLTALFVSGNRVWWNYIEDMNLCELPFTEVYQWDEAHVYDNFTNGSPFTDFATGYKYQSTPYPIYWSLIGFGKWQDETLGCQVKEMRPSFWAKAIIDKIFEVIPITLKSEFFESNYFQKVLCFMMDAGAGEFSDTYKSANFNAEATGGEASLKIEPDSGSSTSHAVRFTTDVYDPGNNFEVDPLAGFPSATSYSYKAPATGTYNILFSIEFTDTSSYPAGIEDFVLRYQRYIPFVVVIETVEVSPLQTVTAGNTITFNGQISMDKDDHFRFSFLHDVTSFVGGAGTGYAYNASIEVTAALTYYTEGHPFEVKRILPCTPVIDFLKGLTHAFNLQFIYDSQKDELTVEPYNDAYLNLSTYDDWSERIDVESVEIDFIITELTNQQKFNWQKDGADPDDLNSYTNEIDSKFSQRKVTEFKNPYFAATQNYLDTNIGLCEIPRFWKSERTESGDLPDQSFSFKPRLLMLKGYGRYTNESWTFNGAPTPSIRIPKAMQVGNAALLSNDISCDFTSLFNLFYAKNFKDIEQGSVVNAEVILDLGVFKDTDFRVPKLVKFRGMNVYLRLLKIEQFKLGGDKKTKCEFIYWRG